MQYKLLKAVNLKEVIVNEELYEIPDNWNVCKLDDLFEEYSIKGINDLPLLMASQIHGVIVKPKDEKRVDNMKTPLSKFKVVYKDSFVIGLRAFEGGIEHSKVDGVISPAYSVLRNKIDIDYFYFKKLLKHFNFIQLLQRFKIGIRDGQNLPFKDLKTLELFIPPLEEQINIVDILKKQENLIKSIKKLISKLQTRNQFFSEILLSGKILIKEENSKLILYKNFDNNWKEVEINGEMTKIPNQWSVEKISKNIKFSIGNTPLKLNDNYDGDLPWITISDLKNKHIFSFTDKIKKLKNVKILPKGTLLGSFKMSVGKFGFTTQDCATNEAIIAIKPTETINNINYLYYKLPEVFLNNAEQNGQGTLLLNTTKIKDLDYVVPPMYEQLNIVTFLSKQENLINQQKSLLKQEAKKLEWLLDNLLFGKCLVEKKQKDI